MSLTPKRLKFCAEYMIDLNIAQAAIRAGFSETYAKHRAAALLSDVGVAEEIARLKVGLAEKVGIKAENVVNELVKVGFSNIGDFLTVDDEGEVLLRAFEGIAPEKLAVVESIKLHTTRNKDESREYTTTQFKLHNKLNALEQLCKHLGLFEKDNVQRGGLSIVIEAPQQEVQEVVSTITPPEIVIKGLVNDGRSENKT